MVFKELFDLEYVEGELVNDEWESEHFILNGVKDIDALPADLVIPSFIEDDYGDELYVKEIACGAFRGIKKLRSVVIEGTTEIGEEAFMDCTGLTSVTFKKFFPRDIGKDTFCGCTALSEVRIPDLEGFCKASFDNEFANPIFLAERVYINDVPLGDCLEIPETVDYIYGYAFCGCKAKTIKLPPNVDFLGRYAFAGCPNLEAADMSRGVKRIEKYVFAHCPSLKTVVLPDEMIYFYRSAFKDCANIEYIVHDGLKYWGSAKNPFKAVVGVAEERASVTLHYDAEIVCRGVFENNSVITEFTANEKLKQIDERAFCNCPNLKRVYITPSVARIGQYAFDGCNVREVHISDIGAWCGIRIEEPLINRCANPLETAELFINGKLAEHLVIPPEVKSINGNAFLGCRTIKSVVIADGVTHIGDRAFARCSSLLKVTFPKKLKSVGYGAFEECTSLTAVELPPVPTVGRYMFNMCTALERVSISKGTENIDAGAFRGCKLLTNIKIADSVKTIDNEVFCGCRSLSEIVLPLGLNELGRGAFKYCKSLKAIAIPSKVENIEDSLFEDCTALAEISMPRKLLRIFDCAFKNCVSLKRIEIPDGLWHVGDDIFEGCNSSLEIIASEKTRSKYKLAVPGANPS